MIVTEEEAKTKWCPFARVATTSGGGIVVNRFSSPMQLRGDSNCLGSACMMWQSYGTLRRDGVTRETGYCGISKGSSDDLY